MFLYLCYLLILQEIQYNFAEDEEQCAETPVTCDYEKTKLVTNAYYLKVRCCKDGCHMWCTRRRSTLPVLIGNETNYCINDKWLYEWPRCLPRSPVCANYKNKVPNGEIKCIECLTECTTTEKYECRIQCKTGYYLEGRAVNFCSQLINFQYPLAKCIKIIEEKCEIEPEVEMVNVSCNPKNGVPGEKECKYTCMTNNGRQETSRVCEKGQWKNQLTTCNGDKKCPKGQIPVCENTKCNCVISDSKECVRHIIENGIVSCKGHGSARKCSFSCHKGFILHGPDVLGCSSYGVWDKIETPICKPDIRKDCDYLEKNINLSNRPNLTVTCRHDGCYAECKYVGSDLRYDAMVGERINYCLNGAWIYEWPKCSKAAKIPCYLSSKFKNGKLNCIDCKINKCYEENGQISQEEHQCTILCEPGFHNVGKRKINYCTGTFKKGFKHNDWQTCEVKKKKPCGISYLGETTSITCRLSKKNTDCEMTCGFPGTYERNIRYCRDNRWTPGFPTCTASSGSCSFHQTYECDKLNSCVCKNKPGFKTCTKYPILNGRRECRFVGDMEVCKYKCFDGFVLNGPLEQTCLKYDLWYPFATPVCEDIEKHFCHYKSNPEGEIVTCEWNNKAGAFHCKFECHYNDTLIGYNVKICKNGKWSSSLPVCKGTKKECKEDEVSNCYDKCTKVARTFTYENKKLIEIPNNCIRGSYECECVKKQTSSSVTYRIFDHGVITCGVRHICKFTCVPGFKIRCYKNEECPSHFKLLTNSYYCHRIPCPKLLPPWSIKMTCTPNSDDAETCSFYCSNSDEFYIKGNSYLTCNRSKWSSSIPICEKKLCGELLGPAFGRKSTKGDHNGWVTTFTCNKDYVMEGPTIVSCDEYGNINGSSPKCEPKCQTPDRKFAKLDCNETENKGMTCTIKCESGYALIGSNSGECPKSNQWSPKLGNCFPTVKLEKWDYDALQITQMHGNQSVYCDGNNFHEGNLAKLGNCFSIFLCYKSVKPYYTEARECLWEGVKTSRFRKRTCAKMSERCYYDHPVTNVFYERGPPLPEYKCDFPRRRYKNPHSCLSFFECIDDKATVNMCHKGFVFDGRQRMCMKGTYINKKCKSAVDVLVETQ